MSDTTTCSSCEASVPSAAAFCTSCGQAVAAAPPPTPPAPPAPPPAADQTNVDGPSFADQTAVGSAPSTEAPWGPPAHPAPPTWQQPAAPPPAAAPAQPGTWTPPGQTPPPGAWGTEVQAPPAKTSGGGSIFGGIAAVLGGLLTLAGVFSGWVKLGTTGTISAWSMTTGDELLKSNDPYLLVLAGMAAVVLGILLFIGIGRPVVRVVAIVGGLAIVVTAALNWLSITNFVTDEFPTSFEASAAIGFYLALVGGILTAIAGLLPAKK